MSQVRIGGDFSIEGIAVVRPVVGVAIAEAALAPFVPPGLPQAVAGNDAAGTR